MRIASSTTSRRETSGRRGSNGRGRATGKGSLSVTGGASGSRASSIGERSNKRGCLNLSSQALGSDQDALEQDLCQDHNGEEEDEDEVEDEMEDLVDEELYERGPALMPEVPREEDKVVLTPLGDRQWREQFTSKEFRSPNGIIGLLIRRNYPGIVTYKGSQVAAHKFDHYRVIPEPTANSTQQPTSALQKIETKFWYYFKWADGKEAASKRVVRNVIKKLVPNAFYEARLQSVITYHRYVLKDKISRSEARKEYPLVEEYMKAMPYWFATCPNAWRKLAELWNTQEWKAKSRAGRARKEKKLRIHRQGSASIARYQRNLEKKLKRPVFEIEAFLRARMVKGTDYADDDARANVIAYGEACEEIHGPDFEWEKEPIDGVAAYKAGRGKKHGRYLVGDGMISTPEVLCEVRASATASESQDEPLPRQRRRPNPEEAQAIEQQVHEEMDQRLQQEREEMERKLQQEREDMDRKLQQEREEMERKLNLDREEMERKLQQEREAWEREMQPERDYYNSAILAITQRLQIDLPQPPRPHPRRVAVSHQATSNSVVSQVPQDAAPEVSNGPSNASNG